MIAVCPRPDPTRPYGFAVEATVPGGRWLRHWQQHLDNTLPADLQALQRIQALKARATSLTPMLC